MIGTSLWGFGDKRRECVGGALLAAMQQHRTLCVHRLAKDRNQAIQFGRFLANSAVTVHEMLATAGYQTSQRVAGRHVLAIEDTTELHFPTHAASKRCFGTGGNGAGGAASGSGGAGTSTGGSGNPSGTGGVGTSATGVSMPRAICIG